MIVLEKWEYTSIELNTTGFKGGILNLRDFDDELNMPGEVIKIALFKEMNLRFFVVSSSFLT